MSPNSLQKGTPLILHRYFCNNKAKFFSPILLQNSSSIRAMLFYFLILTLEKSVTGTSSSGKLETFIASRNIRAFPYSTVSGIHIPSFRNVLLPTITNYRGNIDVYNRNFLQEKKQRSEEIVDLIDFINEIGHLNAELSKKMDDYVVNRERRSGNVLKS